MARLALMALTLAAGPAAAWEFTADPVCTLSHDAGAVQVVVTYQPGLPQPYAIAVTRAEPWPPTDGFAMRFEGGQAMEIRTDRQTVGPDGRTLTVTDTGFGNVLDGLQFNTTATLRAGGLDLPVPLDGAAPEVAAFRICPADPVS